MNKKTLTILLSTVAGVVILGVVALLVFSNLFGKDSGKKKDDVSSTASLAGQSEVEGSAPDASDAGDSAEAETGSKAKTGTESATESGAQTGSQAQTGDGDAQTASDAQSADGSKSSNDTQTASGAQTVSDAKTASETATASGTKTTQEGQTASEAKTGSTAQSSGNETASSANQNGSASQSTDGEEIAIAVGNVSAKAGQNIKVPVTVTKNPGVFALLLQFDYDTDSLEYLNVENASLFADCQSHSGKGFVKVVLSADQDVKKDGDILYLHFKVKQKAKATSTIKIFAKEGDIGNYDEKLVSLKPTNGTVTVK